MALPNVPKTDWDSSTVPTPDHFNNIEENIADLEDDKLELAGGTLTGAVVAHNGTDYTTLRVRNIYLSTEDPDDEVGGNGDIWLKYTP